MQQEFIAKITEFVATKKKSLIVTHRQPDGDALGASLAWLAFLRMLGCETEFLSPTDITRNLDWLPFYSEAISFEQEKNKARALKIIEAAEVVYCLDFNSLSRLEELGEHIALSSSKKVMIDHHREPENFADLAFSDIRYAATSEMIFDTISAIGKKNCITPEIATLLYAGICTDTGFFQFNNTTPNIFKVASELVEKGAQPDVVSDRVNNIFHERRLNFFGYCLDRKLKLTCGGKVAYMMVSAKEIKRFRLQNGDSEGLVNYPFKIKGVEMTAYFSEEGDKIKVSLRSRGNWLDMNQFARMYFDGGGHFNASGGKSFHSMEETEAKFLKAVETLFSAKP
jgi:phosphoesterase RecJ-like protein